MTEISSNTLSKINLTLVEDGLGDITREQYEEAINRVIPSAYDAPDSTFINIDWKAVGSTKIELSFESFDAHDYEQSVAYDREVEYVTGLLEQAYTYACENA